MAKTELAKPKTIKNNWRVVDLKGKVLGRAASQIAHILRGKDKTNFTPGAATGDFVIALNASEVKFTGAKADGKIHYFHTGYFGHMRQRTAGQLRDENPEKLVRLAVYGMLPKGPLGRKLARRLKIYAGNEHPHTAQAPKSTELPS